MEVDDVTNLLNQWARGDRQALNALLPSVYAELRRLAQSYLRRERSDHTLQPTALINESIARLLGGKRPEEWESRAQLIGIMARTMREILVDAARRHNAAKRPNPRDQVDFEGIEIAKEESSLLGVDDALKRLNEVHPRQARVVELKYFGGLSLNEIADVMNSSEATVTRDWRLARAWLRRDIEFRPD
jgi:RNA polymerase sigma-70 factor, ECF subfamily